MTIMFRLTTALVLLAAEAANAQGAQCSAHEEMSRHLAENWGESRQTIALDAANSVVELFASEETGTWTLTVTSPDGQTCMVASGHAFEMTKDPLPVIDEGA